MELAASRGSIQPSKPFERVDASEQSGKHKYVRANSDRHQWRQRPESGRPEDPATRSQVCFLNQSQRRSAPQYPWTPEYDPIAVIQILQVGIIDRHGSAPSALLLCACRATAFH